MALFKHSSGEGGGTEDNNHDMINHDNHVDDLQIMMSVLTSALGFPGSAGFISVGAHLVY